MQEVCLDLPLEKKSVLLSVKMMFCTSLWATWLSLFLLHFEVESFLLVTFNLTFYRN